MKRNLMLGLSAVITLSLAGTAIGAPSASAAPSAKPADAKSAAPSGSAAPSSAAALPAGHPEVGDKLPPGHPAVDDDAPPQGQKGVDPRFFNAPQDAAIDDPSLPPGTIVVSIKDAQRKPIARAPITLAVLHSTVAKGESRERKSREADENGEARFDGLAFGSGHSYRVTTTRGGATYGQPPVALADRAGKRIYLHAYETATRVEDLSVAMQGVVYISLRDDSIQVEQLLSIYNLGAVSWIADATFDLPAGFKAFNKQDAAGEGRIDEVPGTGAAVRGTFPPGRQDLDFRYQIPLDSAEKQTLRIRLPPRVAQARVMAESSRSMGLEVKGFPTPQRTEARDGKRLLVTEMQASRSDGGVREIEITLSGLPTRPGRWVALVLAGLALAGGLYYFAQHGSDTADDEVRGDLKEAREALLGEIVALERAWKSGEIGPKTYARVRASLVDALARIVTMIDEAEPKVAKPKAQRPKVRPA